METVHIGLPMSLLRFILKEKTQIENERKKVIGECTVGDVRESHAN
jgi:hypothetical protein